MIWRIITIVALLAILVGGGVWVAHGAEVLSKDKRAEVIETKDPLFGTTQREVKYVDEFTYGFLPLDDSPMSAPTGYVFVLGSGLVAMVFATIMRRRARS